MENENKPVAPVGGEDDFLEPYYKKPFFNPTFWRWMVMLAAVIAAVIFFKRTVLDPSMDAKELKAAIELFDVSSQWVVREKAKAESSQGVVVVPEITFRIRNVGKHGLRYVYCITVFRYVENGKLIGEGAGMTLHQPLLPGRESEPILMRAPFGYQASSPNAFLGNPKEWRRAFAEIFAYSRNSKTTSLKWFYISHKIAGQDIDVTVK